MKNLKIKALIAESKKRNKIHFDVGEFCFKSQLDLINDESKLKAVLTTRRSGKSMSAAAYLIHECFKTPNVSCLYIALTRGSAKKIIWKDCLKFINRKYKLNLVFNETELSVRFPNGSILYCMGMDDSESEQEKALGQKFKLVVIDEAASFRQDLRQIIFSTLKPATSDYRGTILLIGTPGNNTRTFFYEVTTGKEAGWNVHKWSAYDNPHMAKQWEEEIDSLKKDNPDIEETPWFRQMYRGEWVVDTEKLVYKFEEDRNTIDKLPDDNRQMWHYVLSCDLGYNDDTAIAIMAYRKHDRNLYVVESWKAPEMIVEDVAEKIKHFQAKYKVEAYVVDPASKQVVEELKRRYRIPFRSAEKSSKHEHIGIMNSEFLLNRIKLVKSATYELIDEYKGLIWYEKNDKRIEHPNCPNHLTDAALYGFRYCYPYLNPTAPAPKARPDSQEAIDSWWSQQGRELEKKNKKNWWES